MGVPRMGVWFGWVWVFRCCCCCCCCVLAFWRFGRCGRESYYFLLSHLKLRVVVTLEELDEARHHPGVDHLLNRWVPLCGGKRGTGVIFVFAICVTKVVGSRCGRAPIESSLRNLTVASRCTALSLVFTAASSSWSSAIPPPLALPQPHARPAPLPRPCPCAASAGCPPASFYGAVQWFPLDGVGRHRCRPPSCTASGDLSHHERTA